MARQRKAKGRKGNEIEFSRIVAFSDGVFAIAITLLVLNLTIDTELPGDKLAQEIWDQRESFVAYAISFAVIGRFWLIHHRFFGEVEAFDTRLLTLNMLYLAFIVLIPFSSEVFGEYGDEPVAIAFYAVDLAACVLIGHWMASDAYSAGFTSVGTVAHRESLVSAVYVVIVFLASIPLAFLVGGLAPLIWLAFFFDPGPWLVSRRGHRRKPSAGPAGGGSVGADEEGD